jgi:hypothetical protein
LSAREGEARGCREKTASVHGCLPGERFRRWPPHRATDASLPQRRGATSPTAARAQRSVVRGRIAGNRPVLAGRLRP